MRKGLFAALLATAGMMFSLVGCGKADVRELSINNKEEMQAEWLGDAEARTLSLTIKKNGEEQNALTAVQEGDLVITSSNTSVATVQGLKVSPVDGEGGTSTITATWGDVSDSVDVTVTKVNKHGKIQSDPLTVTEAIAICKAQGKEAATSVAYFIKGVVTGVTAAYDPTYGNISFKIGETKTSKDTVTVYRAKPATGVDYSVISSGSEVLVTGNLINYNGNTPEVNQGGTILSATQGYVPQYVNATVAEALAAAKALPDNAVSDDYYVITGYIAFLKSAKEFYLSDTAETWEAVDAEKFEVYGWNGDNKDDLAVGLKVKVTAFLKHYQSTSDSTKYAYETDTPKSVEILQTGIALDKTTATIVVGATATLTPSIVPSVLTLGTVTWSSSVEAVATVAAGVVTAVAVGETVITATNGDFTATCAVTVVAATKPATAVTLNKTALNLEVPGETATLTATVTPADTTDQLSWTSSVPAVASVSAAGVVTPLSVGTTVITAKYNDNVHAECTVTVAAKHGTTEADPLSAKEAYDLASTDTTTDYYIKGVTQSVGKSYAPTANPAVEYSTVNLYVDGTNTFQLYHLDVKNQENATKAETIGAIVVAKGKLSVFNDTRESGSPEFISATVPETVSLIFVNGDTDIIIGDDPITLTANVYPTSATNKTVTWASLDESKATVTDAGVVTAVAEGEVKITATVGEVVKEFVINVWELANAPHGKKPSDPLTVSEAVAIGDPLNHNTTTPGKYYISGYVDNVAKGYDNGDGKKYLEEVWITDGTSRFELYKISATSEQGDICALGSTIVAKCQIKKFSSTIENGAGAVVSVDNTNFTLVKVTGDDVLVPAGNTTLEAKAYPLKDNSGNNKEQPTFTWTSSAEAVATVDAGEVTGVAKGQAEITATAGNLSGKLLVSVAYAGPKVVIADYAATNSWVNSTAYQTVNIDSHITATANDSTNMKYYSGDSTWRFYQNKSGAITITAENGYVITSIIFTYTIGNTGCLHTSNDSSVATPAYSSGVAIPLNNVTTFTAYVGNTTAATNGQVKILSIQVIYDVAQ